MNASVVDLKPSLRSAQQAFDQWRSSRTQRGPTPMALRQCAVALLDQHCAFHICRALRINANALKQWSGTQDAPLSASAESLPVEADSSAAFIRLPEIDEVVTEPVTELASTLIIELPNETVIRVRRTFTLDEVFQAAARLSVNTSSY